MALAEAGKLLEFWDRNVCPTCGKAIPPNTRVGTGRKADGGFCSLDCYARYRSFEFSEKAKGLGAAKSEDGSCGG